MSQARTRREMPTVLIVAMANSIHTVRWIDMIRSLRIRILLVPVDLGEVSPDLTGYARVSDRRSLLNLPDGHIGVFDFSSVDRGDAHSADAENQYRRAAPLHMELGPYLATPLDIQRAIQTFEPDLVHSLEVQSAGYLTLEAQRRLGDAGPPWLLSNWGSDIYLYERLADHRPVVMAALQRADGYLAECRRDIRIAHRLGFSGRVFEEMPASGGADFARMPSLSDLPPTSARKAIMIKGYHGWAGRGLHILSALHLAAPSLRDFEIQIILASEAAREMADALRRRDGLNIRISNYVSSHGEALRRLGEARIVVGLGISDGISTTLLEAMALGVYPIQGDTSCACEWVRDGVDADMVSPHDITALASAIVSAASDDGRVDRAALRNRAVVEQKWDIHKNAVRAKDCYQSMLNWPVDLQNPAGA